MLKFILTLMLCWDVHPETNQFKLYQNGVFKHSIEGTRTSVELYNDDTATFTVTAIKDGLESDHSEPLTFHAPRMTKPTHSTLTFTRPKHKANQEFVLESSTDLVSWDIETDFTEIVIDQDGTLELVHITHNTPNPMKFYRVRIKILPVDCAAQPQ
jgi:hypothetical protein